MNETWCQGPFATKRRPLPIYALQGQQNFDGAVFTTDAQAGVSYTKDTKQRTTELRSSERTSKLAKLKQGAREQVFGASFLVAVGTPKAARSRGRTGTSVDPARHSLPPKPPYHLYSSF